MHLIILMNKKKDDKEVFNRGNKESQGIDRGASLNFMVDSFNDVYKDKLPFEIKKENINI